MLMNSVGNYNNLNSYGNEQFGDDNSSNRYGNEQCW